jgi:starch phosphorylase
MRKFTWEFLRHLFYTQGRALEMATPNDLYMALAYTVRNQLLERWLNTVQNYTKPGVRFVGYLSAEFLLGPHLENNLINLGIYDEAQDALKDLSLDLRKMIDQEENQGWNGVWELVTCYRIVLPRSNSCNDGNPLRLRDFDQEIRDSRQVED